MKKLVITATAVATLLAGLLPSSASARLGDNYEALKKDRIMKALLMENDVKPPLTSVRVYEVRPQAQTMKNNIYMKLQFDANERLQWAELWISEEYRKQDAPFSKHFIGLFLYTQLHPSDTASLRPLMTELQYREENPDVRLLGDIPKLPKEPSLAYKASIAQAKKFDIKLKKSQYSITTVNENKRKWTKVRVEPK